MLLLKPVQNVAANAGTCRFDQMKFVDRFCRVPQAANRTILQNLGLVRILLAKVLAKVNPFALHVIMIRHKMHGISRLWVGGRGVRDGRMFKFGSEELGE